MLHARRRGAAEHGRAGQLFRAGRAHTARAGCPAGRVAELVRTGKLALHGVRHFVLDEVRAAPPRAGRHPAAARRARRAGLRECARRWRRAARAELRPAPSARPQQRSARRRTACWTLATAS